jgi:hypothetical protein
MVISEKDFEAIALALGLRKSALQDAMAQYPDDGATSVSEWLPKMRSERPHWFELQTDGTEAALYSLKDQGAYIRQHGEGAAAELLAANGLKIGQIKQAPKPDAETIKGADNPYSDQSRLTPEERQKKIASMIRSMPTSAIASIAKAAGKKIDGTPLNKR